MKFKTFSVTTLALLSLLGLMVMSLPGVSEARDGKAMRVSSDQRPRFPAGAPDNYLVWHDSEGWHLRVTTDGLHHRFRGSVELPEGTIVRFNTIGLMGRGVQDRAWVENGNKIGFDLVVHGGIQGFDWQMTANCSEFNLFVDGKAQPNKIFVGSPGQTPSAASFDICQGETGVEQPIEKSPEK